MYDVLHPATSEDSDPALRNPIWYILAVCAFLLAVVDFKLGVIAAVLGGIAQMLVSHYKENQDWKGSELWPVTTAKVEYASARKGQEGRRSFPMGELAYSYSAAGAYYSGFCRCRFTAEKDAEAFIEAFREKSIPVRYNPGKPEVSLMTAADLWSVVR